MPGFGCIAHGEPPDEASESPIVPRDPHRPWTSEDVALARSLATPERSNGDIAAQLGRTEKSIKHLFERLGVSKPRVRGKPRGPRNRGWAGQQRTRKRWSDEEDAALEDGEVTILVRARSHWAIASRAKRLGQPLRSGDGAMSVRQVAVMFDVRHPTVLDWIGRGLLPATRAGNLWRIDPGTAERVVPGLKAASRAHAGHKAWWRGRPPGIER